LRKAFKLTQEKRNQNNMPTERQKKLAKELVENQKKGKPDNKTNILVNLGYSEKNSQKNQKEIIMAKGTQEALKEYEFDADSAKNYTKGVLNNPDSQKVGLDAVKEIFKVCGSYAPEKQQIEHELRDNDLDDASKEIVLKHQIALKKELMDNIQKKAKNEPLK